MGIKIFPLVRMGDVSLDSAGEVAAELEVATLEEVMSLFCRGISAGAEVSFFASGFTGGAEDDGTADALAPSLLDTWSTGAIAFCVDSLLSGQALDYYRIMTPGRGKLGKVSPGELAAAMRKGQALVQQVVGI